MTRVSREMMVEESVNILVRNALTSRGFPTSDWRMVESYPYDLTTLDTNIIACGFNFDDGGRQFEIGSNLKERKYTLEFFVFGKTLTYAKSLANAIKFSIEADMSILLYDITQVPPVLEGEVVYVDHVHSHHQPIPEPEPWQSYVWMVTAEVTDYYVPAMT